MAPHEDKTQTLRGGDGSRSNASVAWRLSLVYPPPACAIIPLAQSPLVIGRAPEGDHVHTVVRQTISRSHLVLERRGAVWQVQDLGSRNGTWVDRMPIGSAPYTLVDGSVLRFGDVVAVCERVVGELRESAGVALTAIPGCAVPIVHLRSRIETAAADPSPILIIGETGTGKELTAAEIHRLSQRRGPFVTLSCAELSPTVIESQLFGHDKGAFTGASASHRGLFRAADGGTLFLDEIGELPLDLQPKLLRAIQTGEIRALGSTSPAHVDVRLVSATNRDLRSEVESGTFRRDLYARLSLHEVRIPALRERRRDIYDWVSILARQWALRRSRPPPVLDFTAEAVEVLLTYPWPENLRGLDRLVHGLAPTATSTPFGVPDLPTWVREATPESADPPRSPSHASSSPSQSGQAPRPFGAEASPRPFGAEGGARSAIPDRAELLDALERHGWVVQAVAKAFGRDRRQIYRWMTNYDIKRPD